MSMLFRLAWLFVALALIGDGTSATWRDFVGLQLLGAVGWGFLFHWPTEAEADVETPQETER
jgi:hypothetical protein